MLRSESIAYPKTNPMSRLTFCLRQNFRAVIATCAFFVFVIVLSMDSIHHPATGTGLRAFNIINKPSFGGAVHPGYFDPKGAIIDENSFHFAACTDLDQLSRIKDEFEFHSYFLPGIVTRNPENNQYSIQFEETRELISKHNEGGRGMELSEMTLYNNRLLAFDDRTGSVFEILSKDDGKASYVAPRFVVTEGEGDTDKGMKWEWACVKNGELYLGSMGKEYTRDGVVVNTNNLWIAIVNARGEIRREDWSEKYMFIRKALGALPPGYVIHEAVLWSSYLKKWVFVPRRISSEEYNDVVDEKKGSNKLLLVDEAFTTSEIVTINMKELNPLHGFSTVAFVPNSRERHALAVRTVEDNCVGGDEDKCKQESHFLIFDIVTGEVLMDEVKYDEGIKFEGVEFVNVHTPEIQ